MRNKLMMSGLMALALGLGVSGTALAYQGDSPNYSSDFKSKITKIMSNKDYQGWKNLVEEKVGSQPTNTITQDNFDKFVEAWKLANEGKIKEANKLRREIEIANKN